MKNPPKPDFLTSEEYALLDNYYQAYDYNETYDYSNPSIENTVINESITWNANLQAITILINIIHFLILIRKQLRSNAVYIYMMAICLSDILNFSLSIYDLSIQYVDAEVPRRIIKDEEGYFCLDKNWIVVDIEGQITITVFEITKRLSIWLAILMAFIRTASVIFPMNERVQRLAKAKATLLIIFLMLFGWIWFQIWHIPWFFMVKWYPDVRPKKTCPPQPKSELEQYILVVPFKIEDWFSNEFYKIEVILKFIPTILYPVLTIGLLIQLHIYKKKRQKTISTEGDKSNTTTLVLFMTVTFMLSEGLAGIYAILRFTQIYWVKFNKTVDWSLVLVVASYQVDILRTVNALSHPIICFLMSAQYRDTVTGVFSCCGARKKNNMSSAAAVFRKSSKKSTSMGTVAN